MFLYIHRFAMFPTIACDSGTHQGETTKKDPESLALSEKVELSQCVTLGLHVPSAKQHQLPEQ